MPCCYAISDMPQPPRRLPLAAAGAALAAMMRYAMLHSALITLTRARCLQRCCYTLALRLRVACYLSRKRCHTCHAARAALRCRVEIRFFTWRCYVIATYA